MSYKFVFWFDLENPPDVLFFEPIVTRLKNLDHTVLVTYRDYADVPALTELYGVCGQSVGRHAGKNKIKKICAGLYRSYLLGRWSKKRRIDLAVGFGSRPLAVTCGLLRIPNSTVFDYEHVSIAVFNLFCDWIFIPQEVPTQYLVQRGMIKNKIIKYRGLKEEVYAGLYTHNDNVLLKHIGYDKKKVVVTIRPPATKAHYHDHSSEIICRRVLEKISRESSVMAILLERDNDTTFEEYRNYTNITRLSTPAKGLDLIANSDLVISGGGTMVREAAALGVPSYSIFSGQQGAVDERLSQEGRLTLIRKPEDVDRICFRKHEKKLVDSEKNTSTLDFFVDEFIRLAGLKKK